MADYRLQIVTSQKTVFDEKVTATTLPGEQGFFGVLAHHAPIVAVLKNGPVDIRQGNNTRRVTITGGFFEFEHNNGTLLADELFGIEEKDDEEE
jgi:F-type H+-transporting ATPase subunit epsilon